MSLLKKLSGSVLLKASFIYTGTRVINSAIPFLMMPILTRYLTPVDYGIVTMFQVLVGIIGPFTGLSINGAINRQYYERDKINFPKYVANSFYLLLLSTFIVGLFFVLFAPQISSLSAFPKEWLWAVLLVSFCHFIIAVVLLQWQVQVKPLYFGIFQITNTILNVSLSLWFVVLMGFDWQGRIQGQVITAVIFALIAFYVLWKNGWLAKGLSKRYMMHGVKFGVPLIPHSLGSFLITMTDRFFITNMVGIAETGLYAVGYQFGNIIGIIQDSFNKAWVPWLYERLKKDDDNEKIRIVKITYIYFVGILLLALVFSLIAPWFLSFFVGDKFTESGKYVFWIAIGYAFNGMYKMVTNYIFYAEKTSYLAWVTFLTAMLNVVFTYLFIKMNGPIGAAQGTALAFFISFVLTWLLSQRVYKMPWGLKK
ncbi:flippase [Mesobacillus jeotgali]|uniref:Flippase n=1 Tax=Mesobacillus jeotgali TaxID=129985 RepID=A0ABY9VIK1_9BACI|nr:flippase [Mesobacillus jeotgali]WNF22641.1 flippase [Mesobacillus jeotgali]